MSDLPGVLAEIAQLVGEEAARRIGGAFAGCRLDIPSARTQTLAERDEEIQRRFNGANLSELARAFGLSRMQVYRILKKGRRS